MHHPEHKLNVSDLLEIGAGAGIGAALTYVLDPDVGKRRRALLRDQAVHAVSKSVRAADVALRDVQNRGRGLLAELSASLKAEQPSDDVLAQRIRSRIGRYASRPSAIDVDISDGCVELRGDVLDTEEPALLFAVTSTRGVKTVENFLRTHASPGDIPGRRGERSRARAAMHLMEEQWSPAARLVAGTAGSALLLNTLSRRTRGAAVLGLVGAGLVLRALTNVNLSRLLGASSTSR